MASNRQDIQVELKAQRRALKGKGAASEVKPMLDDVEQMEVGQLQEVIVEPARKSYVEIAGVRMPAGVLLMIAAHLDLQSFIALSATNAAVHRALTGPRIIDSLYVEIPGVAGQYTVPALKSMLQSGFPELAKQKRLAACAKINVCVHSCQCGVPYGIAAVVTSLGGGFTALSFVARPLKNYLLYECGFSWSSSVALVLGVGVSTVIVCSGVAGAAFGLGYELAVRCGAYMEHQATQHDQAMRADVAINDKLIIFGLFKHSKQSIRQARLYHDSNESLDLPDIVRMGV